MQVPSPTIYAHTLSQRPADEWEPLYGENGHASMTLRYIQSFANPFNQEACQQADVFLRVLALYHDMGKAAPAFQKYLRTGGASVDHKTAAAKWVMHHLDHIYGKMLAIIFHGHHGGLHAGNQFLFSEDFKSPILQDVLAALPEELQSLPPIPPGRLVGNGCKTTDEIVYSWMMAIRMLHSCLIDADWLATEEFTTPQNSEARKSTSYVSLLEMSKILEWHLERREFASTGYVNALRKQVHKSCFAAAARERGAYQLNVPTGGGKTLSSLSFALKHAELHRMARVIYVIPYTCIIEQTAQEFRSILGAENVLEHHSSLSEENDTEENRYGTENWDAPLVVTTSVQFFETLFSNRNKKCRKIHNIAHSVIILDEAQTLPAAYLKPCLYALKSLQRDFGCTVVLCTATQPTVVNDGRFNIGWEKGEVQSLVGESLENRLAEELKRVKVENLGRLNADSLIQHYSSLGSNQALFIVNLTRQAQDLYERLYSVQSEGIYHLSARMCPLHRSEVLRAVRSRLAEGLPVLLIATRVVEAGVDISFPVVYRDSCGLDSLAQAAGRCNRHGEINMGHVFFYEDEDVQLPPSFTDLRDGIYALKDVLNNVQHDDLLEASNVEAYFKAFYNKREHGCKGWDKKGIITDSQHVATWDFEEISQKFKLIENEQITVIVPYGDESMKLRETLLSMDKADIMPNRTLYRRLSSFGVSVYKTEWQELKAHCELVHQDAGIWFLTRDSFYDSARGLLRSSDVVLDYVF